MERVGGKRVGEPALFSIFQEKKSRGFTLFSAEIEVDIYGYTTPVALPKYSKFMNELNWAKQAKLKSY